jgi:hypothetical protein
VGQWALIRAQYARMDGWVSSRYLSATAPE